MNASQLVKIQRWFNDFVSSLFGAQGSRPASVDLKVEHTQRVAKNAHYIAKEMNWHPDDVLTSEALGWLHDVGRFSQFAEFGHFHDATSINHGERGWRIFCKTDISSSLSKKTNRCLLEGIRHHNARTIPAEISEDALPFLKLIRDADKLDIYRVVLENLAKDGFQGLVHMWPHIKLHGPINPRVLEIAQKQQNCSITDIKSLADFLLLQMSWVYELHYPPTFKQMAQKEYLDALARYLPDETGPREILNQAKQFVAGKTA